jgi:hypothetical protein
VAAVVVLGTQMFFTPTAPLLWLTSGHRYLTRPLLAVMLPTGAVTALDELMRGLDHLLAAALLLLLLGWGARTVGFDRSAFLRGLPVALVILLLALVVWSPLALSLDRSAGWWGMRAGGALTLGARWFVGFAAETLLRGVLQGALVIGLLRLLGRRHRGKAVLLGVVLAAAWGGLLQLPALLEAGARGGDLVHDLIHQGLLTGLVLGAVYARTGDLILAAGLHGGHRLMASLQIAGWPPTASTDLFLLITLVLVAAFISRGILPPRLTGDAGA